VREGRLVAILEALLVTFLWSSSYVLVKIGLGEIGPLTLVALRYTVATLVLVPLALARGHGSLLRDRGMTAKFAVLGFLGYTVAQGLQCVGLSLLPAVSVTFMLNFTPVIVLALGVVALDERPTRLQLAGLAMVLAGAYVYFGAPLRASSPMGIAVTLLSGVGWGAYIVMGRRMFLEGEVPALGLTASSMVPGTVVLLASALAFEGLPVVSPGGWGIIVWLGIVNTALAFFLWNRALRGLGAFEISVLQNTMLIQISVLAWVFLGETISGIEAVAMAMVFMGALIVQLKR